MGTVSLSLTDWARLGSRRCWVSVIRSQGNSARVRIELVLCSWFSLWYPLLFGPRHGFDRFLIPCLRSHGASLLKGFPLQQPECLSSSAPGKVAPIAPLSLT